MVAVAILTSTNLAYGQSPPTISYSPAAPIAKQPIEFYYSGGGPTDLAIYPEPSCPGLEGFGGSNAIVTLVVPAGQYNVTLARGLPSGSYSVGTIATGQNVRGDLVCKNFLVITPSS